MPHAASWNRGQDARIIRIMVYFRLTRTDRPAGCASSYPDAMCNPWLEWRGIRAAGAAIKRPAVAVPQAAAWAAGNRPGGGG